MWYVVVFPEENTVSAVPKSWYIESTNECFWPPSRSYKKQEIEEFVKYQHPPESHWIPFQARILGRYGNYQKAMRKLTKAKDKDTLSSTDHEIGEKRKRKKCRRYEEETDDDRESEGSISFPRFPDENYGELRNEDPLPKKNTTRVERNNNRSCFQEIQQSDCNASGDNHALTATAAEVRTDNASDRIIQVLQNMRNDNNEFKIQILRKLNLMNLKLNDVETSLESLKERDTMNVSQTEELIDFVDVFPLNEERLQTIEDDLAKEDYKSTMIKHLSKIGGVTVGEIVKRLMYKLFTNELGNLYSWDGAKGKKKFKNLRMSDVITRSVRVNQPNATEAEVILNIKKWLVRCRDRINSANKKIRPNDKDDATFPMASHSSE